MKYVENSTDTGYAQGEVGKNNTKSKEINYFTPKDTLWWTVWPGGCRRFSSLPTLCGKADSRSEIIVQKGADTQGRDGETKVLFH